MYYVYILASQRNGTLYTGVTNNLLRRSDQHKSGEIPGFTQRHHVHRLVYFETFTRMEDAIAREKRVKKWKRQWKLRLSVPLPCASAQIPPAPSGPLPPQG